MLRRILAATLFALLPAGAFALPAAPTPTTAQTITGALFDKIVKTSVSSTNNRKQGIMGYDITLHDDKHEYVLPLCDKATLVEVDGNTNIDPNSFVIGDAVTATIQPNAATPAKACVNRIVRQKLNRGASGGECLQGYQMKREIEGEPNRILINTEYNYSLRFYARPTLDCDGKAYGASPITTVVAPGKQFIVTLKREMPGGPKELMRRTLTTNSAGKASFLFTFNAPGENYKFEVTPGGNASPGDIIGWSEKVIDPIPPTPEPTPEAKPGFALQQLGTMPIVIILAVVLIVAGGFEYWHWVQKRRLRELPENEYQRVSRL